MSRPHIIAFTTWKFKYCFRKFKYCFAMLFFSWLETLPKFICVLSSLVDVTTWSPFFVHILLCLCVIRHKLFVLVFPHLINLNCVLYYIPSLGPYIWLEVLWSIVKCFQPHRDGVCSCYLFMCNLIFLFLIYWHIDGVTMAYPVTIRKCSKMKLKFRLPEYLLRQ